jgi:hypothetical protein
VTSLFAQLPEAKRPKEFANWWFRRACELRERFVEHRLCDRCGGCGIEVNLRSCRACRNSGYVLVPPAEWVEAGHRHRAERKSRGEDAHDVAKRMGCQPTDVLAMERGELPAPSQLI